MTKRTACYGTKPNTIDHATRQLGIRRTICDSRPAQKLAAPVVQPTAAEVQLQEPDIDEIATNARLLIHAFKLRQARGNYETVPCVSRWPSFEEQKFFYEGFRNQRPEGARTELEDYLIPAHSNNHYFDEDITKSQIRTPVHPPAKRLARAEQISEATFEIVAKDVRKRYALLKQILVDGKKISDLVPKSERETVKKQVQRLRREALKLDPDRWQGKLSPREESFQPYPFAGVGGTDPHRFVAGNDESGESVYESAEDKLRHRYSWERTRTD
jgi:hypothetical protein